MLTGPWTLDDTWFSSVFYAFTVLENGRKRIVFVVKLLWKQCFVTGKTTVNNKIQTVFPSFNRALNTRKTVVFVELTSRENCTIMERIPDSLTRQQRETLDFRFRKMSENAWIMPCFQIVTTCFLETPVNNRALKTRKTVAFVELTVNENCPIMERILQFAD